MSAQNSLLSILRQSKPSISTQKRASFTDIFDDDGPTKEENETEEVNDVPKSRKSSFEKEVKRSSLTNRVKMSLDYIESLDEFKNERTSVIQRFDSIFVAPEFEDHTDIKSRYLANKVFRENIKRFALYFFGCQTIKALQVIINLSPSCDPEENQELVDTYFSWNLDDLIARCKSDRSQLHLIIKSMDTETLDNTKLNYDISYIQSCIRTIIESLVKKDPELQLKFFNDLQSAKDSFDAEDIILGNLQKQSENIIHDICEIIKLQYKGRFLMKKRGQQGEGDMEKLILEGVETRYRLKYQWAIEDQIRISYETKRRKLRQEIDDLEEKINTESFATQCATNVYYSKCEGLRDKLYYYYRKFEMDSNEWDSKVLATKQKLEKLRAQRQFCEEERIRFKKEIEERIELEAAREARAQKLRATIRSLKGRSSKPKPSKSKIK